MRPTSHSPDDLLSHVGSLDIPADLEPPRRPILPLVVVLGSAVAAIALGLAGTIAARSTFDAQAATTLARAHDSLERALDLEQKQCAALARVLADDTRVRTLLATPGIDERTVRDVLRDLGRASGLAIVGVLGTDGAVQAVHGHDALAGASLAKSSLFAAASSGDASGSAGLWTFQDRPLNAALAPIRLGPDVVAYLLAGRPAGMDAAFEGVDHALVIRGALPADADPRFERGLAALDVAEAPRRVSGDYFARWPLDDLTGAAAVVWTVASADLRTDPRVLWCLWALVGLVLLGTGAATWAARS